VQRPVKIENALKPRRIPAVPASPRKKPLLGDNPEEEDKRWGFSFQYWMQVEHFGFSGKDATWFVSLLDRLCEMSKLPRTALQTDFALKDALRIHRLDWGKPKIPIQRKDLVWLPEDFLNNEAEYPILQFMITKGLGRVAGFWDDEFFNIVLIDPHHNLQPTQSSGYKVTYCKPLENELETVLMNLSSIKNITAPCSAASCSIRPELNLIHFRHHPIGIVYIKEEYLTDLDQMVKDGKVKSLDECIELTILRKSCE
jgi:hypothetical protein